MDASKYTAMSMEELRAEIQKVNQKIDKARNRYKYEIEKRDALRENLCELLAIRDLISEIIEDRQSH